MPESKTNDLVVKKGEDDEEGAQFFLDPSMVGYETHTILNTLVKSFVVGSDEIEKDQIENGTEEEKKGVENFYMIK